MARFPVRKTHLFDIFCICQWTPLGGSSRPGVRKLRRGVSVPGKNLPRDRAFYWAFFGLFWASLFRQHWCSPSFPPTSGCGEARKCVEWRMLACGRSILWLFLLVSPWSCPLFRGVSLVLSHCFDFHHLFRILSFLRDRFNAEKRFHSHTLLQFPILFCAPHYSPYSITKARRGCKCQTSESRRCELFPGITITVVDHCW